MPERHLLRRCLVGFSISMFVIGALAVSAFGSEVSAIRIAEAAGVLSWVQKQPMLQPAAGAGVALGPDGRIYSIGGTPDLAGCTDFVQAYDPSQDTWTALAPSPIVRGNLGAAAVSGRVYAIGGYNSVDGYLAAVEAYDPVSNVWLPAAPMPTSRYLLKAVALDGLIYALGGRNSTGPGEQDQSGGPQYWLNTVEAYDPVSNTWTARAIMPAHLSDMGVATVNGKIYVVGGVTSDYVPSRATYAYDPGTDTWTQKAEMNTARGWLGVTAAGNGRIYAIGGANLEGADGQLVVLATVEEYDPAADSWAFVDSMPIGTMYSGAIGLGNDRFYVVGGQTASIALDTTYEGQIGATAVPTSTPTPTATMLPTEQQPPTATATATGTPSATPTAVALPTEPQPPTATATSPDTPTTTPTAVVIPTESQPPTPAATVTNTPTATPVEIPTDTGVTLHAVQPSQGRSDQVTAVEVYGANLQPNFTYWLGATSIPVTIINSSHVSAKIPACLPAGAHTLHVSQDDQTLAVLFDAYTVVDNQTANDLFSEAVFLWSDPVALRAGDAVQIGLIVQRLGGLAALNMVQVRFLVQQEGQAPVLVGTGIVPALGVDDSASTTGVAWAIAASGEYTITAIIDPDNHLVETDEGNNQIVRNLTVLQAAQDTRPPVIDSFTVNQGSLITASRSISLDTAAHDQPDGAGLGQVMYVEMHWSVGAQAWVPVQFTEWLAYGQSHMWQLHPSPGMRYLQAWVADTAGNISATPAKTLVNYVPETDSLLAGETRILRLYVQMGQCLRITMTPSSGDPDLYVWPPGYQAGQAYWYSILGPGEADFVEIAAPSTGPYQVEIDGIAETEFGLRIEIAESCVRTAPVQDLAPLTKTPRSMPHVSTVSEPVGALALPEQPTFTQTRVFLTWVGR